MLASGIFVVACRLIKLFELVSYFSVNISVLVTIVYQSSFTLVNSWCIASYVELVRVAHLTNARMTLVLQRVGHLLSALSVCPVLVGFL